MKINANTFIGEKPESVLKSIFGYDDFRPFQKEVIENVLQKKDTLVVMPTGGGKSLCYQIPSLIFEGITIVVSPLISLMQDQVNSLRTAGINAIFLNSSLSWEEYKFCVNEIYQGKTKIVYVSPEGLSTGRIREILSSPKIKVSCITIDEAHCVSEWGHDFRPDYLEISFIRNFCSDAVMIALTATATEKVRLDIIKNLSLRKPKVFISSFNRSNIFLEVLPKKNPVEQVVNCIKKHSGESGIIYCFSRKQVDELTQILDSKGYSVLNYHAGLEDEIRAKNQNLFIKDEIQIMVATVAFGMGIDKPNVRFVINYDLPKSLEEYYQEIGRAGRDGLPSTALLLYSYSDIHKIKYFFKDSADPQKSEILLNGMTRFADSKMCRRQSLLAYFGESFFPPEKDDEKKCCCDICKMGDIPLEDMTIPSQKIMCCIVRTNQRFGSSYLIDILLGIKSKRIVENGHDKISTYGIGKELSRDDWLVLIDYLIAKQMIQKSGEYNILKITSTGKSFLVTRNQIFLPMQASGGKLIIKSQKEKISAQKPEITDKIAEKIIDELKKWRKRKSDDLNVPPYAIFGDKTLFDLAAKKPKTKAELLNVFGIGKIKAEEFGNLIIRIIKEIC